MTRSSMGDGSLPSVRRWLYIAMEPGARQTAGLSWLNRLLVLAILFATGIAIAETEKSLPAWTTKFFALSEVGLGCLFAVEYLARIWIAPEHRPDRPPTAERLRFIFSLTGLLDLIVVIASLAPVSSGGALLLRWLRLARILRLAKLGRMSRALDHIVDAVRSRRDELLLTMVAGLALMVLAATALYLAEGAVQPDKFGSIPRALWWAVATLTTIGYGDVYPVTPLGKVLAGVMAVLSIGLIAMPTGILAAAFSDGMERHRRGVGGDDEDA